MELRIKARKNLCDNQLQTMFAGIEAVYTKASCPYSHLNFLSESNVACWLVFAKTKLDNSLSISSTSFSLTW